MNEFPMYTFYIYTQVQRYGGISMTKFNNQELISNYPNCTCINPKLNSNKPILCFKSGMHQTEAEGQKPVSGIMQLVKMQKGILSGKRHNAKRHNLKRQVGLFELCLLALFMFGISLL